jgi:hypothetical protein
MDLYSFGPIRWGSADARFSVGDAGLAGGRVVDGGLGLSVGGRVLRDRLLIRGALGWARSQRSTLAVDGLRVGAGIGVGASLWRRRIWLGGEISPQFLVVRVTDVLVSTVASSSVEMGFHGQIGYQRFMVQLRSGADLVLPPVEGLGREDAISWGGVRFFATLGVGVRF